MVAGTLEIMMRASLAQLSQDMQQATRIVGSATGEISRMASTAKAALEMLGVGLSVGAIAAFAKSTIDAMGSMKDLAEQAGISAEAMSKFEAPTRIAGASLDLTAQAMAKMSKAVVAGYDPLSKQGQAFAAIGISTQQLRSLAPDQLFELIARRLGDYSDGIGKNAVMVEILGRAGFEMNAVMKQIAATTELHASMTQKDIDAAKAFQEEIVKLNMAGDKFWRSIASSWIKTLTDAVTKLEEAKEGAGLLKTELIGIYAIFGGGDASKVDSALDHLAATFRGHLQDMRSWWDNLGNFRDVLLVMLGVASPAQVASAQQASGSNRAHGMIGSATTGQPVTFYGEGATGLADTIALDKPQVPFDPTATQTMLSASNDLNKVLGELLGKVNGFTASFGKDMALITDGFLTGRVSVDQYGKALASLVAQQPAVIAALKAQVDVEAEVVKQLRDAQQAEVDEINARDQLMDSLKDQEAAMKAEIATLGMSEAQRKNYLDTLLMEKELRTALADPNMTDQEAAAVEAEIRARHSNIQAMNTELEVQQQQLSVWSDLADRASQFFGDLVVVSMRIVHPD